jgi:3-methylfumaryl-CoA hydratase
MSIDIARLASWTGRTEDAQDIVTPRLVQSFAATFGRHLAPRAPGEAPLTLHWCLAPPISDIDACGPDGHAAKGEFLPPVPLPRRMWAGGRIETLAPLREGDRVTRHSRIGDISYKEGRSGPLCFVAIHHEYATERGVALRERHDIVYREAAQPGAAAAGASGPAAEGAPADLTWEVEASPLLLFRYSALTFNGHRIHYDFPYATGTEGYAGLVVHGPIQATLIANIIATLTEGAPIRLDYRGLSPLIAGDVFRVKAKRQVDGSVRGWTEGVDGRVRMEGFHRPA